MDTKGSGMKRLRAGVDHQRLEIVGDTEPVTVGSPLM